MKNSANDTHREVKVRGQYFLILEAVGSDDGIKPEVCTSVAQDIAALAALDLKPMLKDNNISK